MRKIFFITFLVGLAGCGHSIKKKWGNFSAYYNTFYNAKKDFNAGLSKEQQQPVTLDPTVPFRIYTAPLAAGSDHFKQAIENGNEVLRRHARSKWTDDALLLIGKSHYYLQEYFPAIQKFESLLNYPKKSALQQQAVIWKGRALFEIQSYRKGVQFLQQALTDFDQSWSANNKAEAQTILAQHLSMLDETNQVIKLLQTAIPHLHNPPLKGRAYLLLGQMLQKNQRYHRAFVAYGHVKSNHPRYTYIYHADLRKAMVAQLGGDVQQAATIYLGMLNDDKNYINRLEINYHLARTYQKLRKFNRAEALYKTILNHQSLESSKAKLISESYFQLGQIYSHQYNDYRVAAAYYDSSSTKALQRNDNGQQAVKLASAYKEYNTLHRRIRQADSLLRLGVLSDTKLKARLARIRINRKQEIEQSQNAVQQTNNKLTNTTPQDVYKTSSSNAASAQFGFLEYHNTQRVRRNLQQFIAIWGNRPLVDNWRRRDALTGDVATNADSTNPIQAQTSGSAYSDKKLGIDVSRIPRSPESRKQLVQQRFEMEYRLGSLFFLTLNQADSAQYYYRRVLAGKASADLKARALYAMYELNNLRHQADRAATYKHRILQQYPGTVYARQVSDKQMSTSVGSPADSTERLKSSFQQLLARQAGTGQDSSLAVRLRRLALRHRSSPLAPVIYFQAIRTYVQFAKAQDSTTSVTDSLAAVAVDTIQYRPYAGANWSRIRHWLTDFKQKFPQASAQNQVDAWLQFLHPESPMPALSCSELHIKPHIIEGKKHFVQSVEMPSKVKKMHLSGTLRYRIIISRSGGVESFKLLSTPTHLGIEPAYEQAMKDHLRFKPITQNGHPVRISCEVRFPIKQ